MLYTKYKSSGPCRTRRFLKIAFWKPFFLTPWPTEATNWNSLNNFDRGPPRGHSCKVWSKSNKRCQRRCCLKKLLTDGRTHRRRTPDIEDSQKLTEHFVLRWANTKMLQTSGTGSIYGIMSKAPHKNSRLLMSFTSCCSTCLVMFVVFFVRTIFSWCH